MSKQEFYEDLCKTCYIKIYKPTKKQIKRLVLSEDPYPCNCCHKERPIVEYIGGED